MPIDRSLWISKISDSNVPNWPCPACGIASLAMVKGSFQTAFDRETKRMAHQSDFDPEWAGGRFICLLLCEKTGCGETCAVSGNHGFSEFGDEHDTWTYASGRPTAITPPPPMIQLPKSCPVPVRTEVEAAFSLFWNDLASSLNRIRNALELVLSDLCIPSSTINSKKKRVRLSLHQRIETLKKKRPRLKDICDRMMAVKHLGNAGSHPGVEVKDDDVFDGFDILERVLQDMYSTHPRELTRAVQQINKRRGLRKR